MSQIPVDAANAVSVARATPDQRPLIQGLAQLYIYDFSEMEPPDATGFVFDGSGTFGPLPGMDSFWLGGDDIFPLLIRLGERVVGFALVNTHSHLTGGAAERNMAEFWVARQFRRGGVATAAVHKILALYPGRWEVAVVERNSAAKAFWPRAIATAPTVSELSRAEGDGIHWTGPVWCFRSAAKARMPVR